MKKFALAFFSLLVAGIVNAQATNAQAVAADISKVLEIKEANHDFGKIVTGKPVEFDLTIKNISNDSVRIENVKVGCGCTTPKYQAGPHAPGSTFKITLGYSNMQEGFFEKYADIYFSNGLHQQVKFFGTGYKVAENAAPANGAVQKLKN